MRPSAKSAAIQPSVEPLPKSSATISVPIIYSNQRPDKEILLIAALTAGQCERAANFEDKKAVLEDNPVFVPGNVYT